MQPLPLLQLLQVKQHMLTSSSIKQSRAAVRTAEHMATSTHLAYVERPVWWQQYTMAERSTGMRSYCMGHFDQV
jgi:hypothetical protein